SCPVLHCRDQRDRHRVMTLTAADVFGDRSYLQLDRFGLGIALLEVLESRKLRWRGPRLPVRVSPKVFEAIDGVVVGSDDGLSGAPIVEIPRTGDVGRIGRRARRDRLALDWARRGKKVQGRLV